MFVCDVAGLHFNMSEGRPVATPDQVQSLVNGEGLFMDKSSIEVAAELGHIDRDEVGVNTRFKPSIMQNNYFIQHRTRVPIVHTETMGHTF